MAAERNIRKRYRICLSNIKDMKAFVEAANCLEGKCELISGNYRVNAKSLIAVLTLLPVHDAMMVEVEGAQTELPGQMQRFVY